MLTAELGRLEVAGREVHARDAERRADGVHGGEKVVPLGREHPFVEVRAGREDLRDVAFDELAGLGVLELVADGDFAAGAQESRDVAVGGVMRQAAHGDRLPPREREVEQARTLDRVVEEHLVEIA